MECACYVQGMLRTIRHFLELIRFSHTLFALPFALLAAVMAWHRTSTVRYFANPDGTITHWNDQVFPYDRFVIIAPRSYPGSVAVAEPFTWLQLVAIVLCMVTARSFAMAFNRLADRQLDKDNARTRNRHLPAGLLSVPQIATFAFLSAVGFIASTLLFLPNCLPVYLSVPVLAFLVGYSYTKRFTSLSHFWLGAALAFSPIAAWIALRGQVVMQHPLDLLPAIVLGGAVLAWVAGFDIIYACQDYDADVRAKLHSVPVRLGITGALRLAAVCHLATIILLAWLPLIYPPFGWIYWAGVAVVAVLLVYEHLLVRPDDLSRVNAAFFNVNAVISLGLFAVGTLDLLVGGR
jgi:4-hydroxybenzoate polyprenyltransferase